MSKPLIKFKKPAVEEAHAIDATVLETDVMMIDQDWHDPFISYLKDGMLPADKVAQQWLEIKARVYLLVDGELYRRGGQSIIMIRMKLSASNGS